MRLSLVSRILGILLILFSVALVPPVLMSWFLHDGETRHFSLTLGLSVLIGAALLVMQPGGQPRPNTRDGFVIVTLLWVVMSLLASMPFIFGLGMNPASAFFEAASAFTTTGATVITGLDSLPASILFYRQELQWLGGIGVIVSAIALLPMLGVGGMQLFKAEIAGPMKDEKLTPRIAHTARAIWRLYAALTVACALLYWAGGMTLFDAVGHAFATLSTGGFSTHDASFAYYNSPFLEGVAIVFMLAGSISFNVHYVAWKVLSPRTYWQNIEARVFLLLTFIVVAVVALALYGEGQYTSMWQAWRYSAFETVSVISSTGFGAADFSRWPSALPVLLMFISFVGGCAGSTSGGIKVIRVMVLAKQAMLEVQRLVHPNLIRPLKIDGRVIKPRIAEAVWGFFAVYVATFVFFMLLLMATGLDQVSAFGAVTACMNNLGPGLGKVASNFTEVSHFGQWLMGFAMLLGRLEIFTMLVLFSPAFWRR